MDLSFSKKNMGYLGPTPGRHPHLGRLPSEFMYNAHMCVCSMSSNPNLTSMRFPAGLKDLSVTTCVVEQVFACKAWSSSSCFKDCHKHMSFVPACMSSQPSDNMSKKNTSPTHVRCCQYHSLYDNPYYIQ